MFSGWFFGFSKRKMRVRTYFTERNPGKASEPSKASDEGVRRALPQAPEASDSDLSVRSKAASSRSVFAESAAAGTGSDACPIAPAFPPFVV